LRLQFAWHRNSAAKSEEISNAARKESREQCQEDSFNRIDAPGLGTTFDILGKLPMLEQNLGFEGSSRSNR
jgi:hypothetical protein